MTDDDRTIDADDDALEQLRRYAADAREELRQYAADARSDAKTNSTVQADESEMDELRRFAAEARHTEEHTVPAEGDAMDELRRYAAEARGEDAGLPSPNPPRDAEHTLDLPEAHIDEASPGAQSNASPAIASPTDRPPLMPPVPSTPVDAVSSSPTPAIPPVEDLPGAQSIDAPAPLRSDIEQGWTPPPRTVMPNEPEKRSDHSDGPWKKVSIALAIAVVVLAVVLAVGFVLGGGDDAPTDDSVPGDSVLIDGTVLNDDNVDVDGDG